VEDEPYLHKSRLFRERHWWHHLAFPGLIPDDGFAKSFCARLEWQRIVVSSRVRVFVYEAKRKIGMFCMSCRSTMNFVSAWLHPWFKLGRVTQ
jgi:hypothetical protein